MSKGKKSMKSKIIGAAWVAGAVLVVKFAWSYFNGEQKVQELKAKQSA